MKLIECFLIAYNQMDFNRYYNQIKNMGENSGSFRDINLHCIQYDGQIMTLQDVYNRFRTEEDPVFDTQNYFSATIAHLGSFLHRHNCSFDYINSFQLEKDYLKEKLLNDDIRLIGISTTMYISVAPIMEIVNFIRTYNQKVKIVLGGPFITTQVRLQDQETMTYLLDSMGVDFLINDSQGEQALVKLVQALRSNNSNFDEIPNLIYKMNGNWIYTNSVAENNCMNDNTIIWSLFAKRMNAMTSVRSCISCLFRCSFCSFPKHAGSYRNMDLTVLEQNLDELDALKIVRSVNFVDDTFNIPQDRFKNILNFMTRKHYGFHWNAHIRCQYLDEETVSLMKESGCEGVFLGIESGNNDILKIMNKKATVIELARGIELLKKYEIVTYASFIIGFPGETEQTVRDTERFIETTQPDFYRLQLWYCDPQSDIYRNSQEFGLKGSHFSWQHKTMDYLQAADYIDELFKNIKHSIWLPQNNFDYPGLFNLINRGWSIDKIKKYITLFNRCINMKLNNQLVNNSEMDQLRRVHNNIQENVNNVQQADFTVAEVQVPDFNLN